jgi:hypothetical protein
MELTEDLAQQIENMPYLELLRKWQTAKLVDPLLIGRSGEFYAGRLIEMRKYPGWHERHLAALKEIGAMP